MAPSVEGVNSVSERQDRSALQFFAGLIGSFSRYNRKKRTPAGAFFSTCLQAREFGGEPPFFIPRR
jgi:hypothetical protein